MATATASSVIIDTGEMFRLRNDHETDTLELTHKRRLYSIVPGQTALVPFELVRIHWGDPRSRVGEYRKFSDSLEDGYVNKRELELARLGVHYGSYASDAATLCDPDWPVGDRRRGVEPKHCPWPVTVGTENGDIIVPACFDFTGSEVYGMVANESTDLNDQVAYREHMERRFEELKAEMARLAGGATDDAEVDAPGR